jgi:hypothetical protein
MIKRLFLTLALLTCLFLCHAQEKGCFKLINAELELDSTTNLGNNKAFVVGEFHGIYGTSEVKLALIKHVNRRYGVTDVFMEIGYSAAWLYNRYLATGDTSLFCAPLLVYAGKQPNRDFWRQLYVWNKALEHKITIHGIDFERMEFVKALKLLHPMAKLTPREIAATIQYLDTLNIAGVNNDSLVRIYECIKQDIDTNRTFYTRYFGANIKTVDQIMFNENTMGKYAERNTTMYRNLLKQTQSSGIKKFIAFVGMNHADKADETSFCSLVAKSDSFKGTVTNIAMVCKNCFDLQLTPDKQTTWRAPYTYEKDSLPLNDIYLKHYGRTCKYMLIPTEPLKDDKVKKFSQYLVLMKNQPEY